MEGGFLLQRDSGSGGLRFANPPYALFRGAGKAN